AARFLFAYPPRSVPRWTENEVADRVRKQAADVVERLVAMPFDSEPRLLPLSLGGRRQFAQLHDELAEVEAQHAGPFANSLPKLRAYAARLALVVHMVRVVAEGASSEQVDEQSTRVGCEMVRWLTRE